MLTQPFDYLSTWEIAHRWLGQDPDTGDLPPQDVRDLLRALAHLAWLHEIPICDDKGVEATNASNAHPGADMEAWCRRHNQLIEGADRVWKQREFDRDTLERIHLFRHHMPAIAQRLNLPLPAFWFTEDERRNYEQIARELTFHELDDRTLVSTPASPDEPLPDMPSVTVPDTPGEAPFTPGKLKQADIDTFWERLMDKQRARLLCRHFAQKLWERQPTLTIADVEKHELVQDWAGAKHYQAKETVRNWIKDLDPRPAGSKPGPRPKTE